MISPDLMEVKEAYDNLSGIVNSAIQTMSDINDGAEVVELIKKVFSMFDGKANIRSGRNGVSYDGKVSFGDNSYSLAGTILFDSLRGNMLALVSDIAMAIWRVKLKHDQEYNTMELIDMLNTL